jgi:hypothetical protein
MNIKQAQAYSNGLIGYRVTFKSQDKTQVYCYCEFFHFFYEAVDYIRFLRKRNKTSKEPFFNIRVTIVHYAIG